MAIQKEIEKLKEKYSCFEDQVHKLSLLVFYDGTCSGEIIDVNGNKWKYNIELLEEPGIDNPECDGQRYYLVKKRKNGKIAVGYITEVFVNNFRMKNWKKSYSKEGVKDVFSTECFFGLRTLPTDEERNFIPPCPNPEI